MQTIMSDYHLLENITAIFIVVLLYVTIFKRLFNRAPISELRCARILSYPKSQFVFVVVLSILFAGGFRGGYGPRPPQLKDAGVTQHRLLNDAVLSPMTALRYAIKTHRLAKNYTRGLEAITPHDIRTEVRTYFPEYPDKESLDEYFHRFSAGPSKKIPKHIFIIVMESYDAWPMQDEYAYLNISSQLKSLAKDGLHIKAFVPSGDGSIATLNTLISGLPNGLIPTNYQASATKPFPTASAELFKKLGYKPQLFYGGYLTWEQLEFFAQNQGFESVYGASHMSNWSTITEWGVDDKTLFDFVDKTITDSAPTFNLIFSTSNHPPYVVDVEKAGFHLKEMEEIVKRFPHPSTNAKKIGHFWYADHVLGKFVRHFDTHHPNSLFAITADHISRRHLLANPPLVDNVTVPLVFYGPSVLKGISLPSHVAGSHLDIIPTLFELAADKGSSYHAMGHNLLAQSENTSIGFGKNWGITPHFVTDTNQSQPITDTHIKLSPISQNDVTNHIRAARAIAWWRIMRGAQLPG